MRRVALRLMCSVSSIWFLFEVGRKKRKDVRLFDVSAD